MKKIIPSLLFCMMFCRAYAASIDVDTPKTITAEKIEYDVKSETIQMMDL